MWTESTLAVRRPLSATLKARVDPTLFALACAMLAVFFYTAGNFAVRMYTDDERHDNSEPVFPAQPW